METAYHDMISLNVSLGYDEKTYRSSQVLPFLKHCACKFPDVREITQEMLDSWLLVREFATDNTRKHVIINIRHFARYLNAIGQKAFVPTEEYNIKVQRYKPHIFTDGELRQLFDSLDSVKPCVKSHAEWILPVLFRLELCCGMRPNEPLNLRVEDVDLRTGDIFIRKSKRGKDRQFLRICEYFAPTMTGLREIESGFSSTGMEENFQQHGQGIALGGHGFGVDSPRVNHFPVLMIFVIALLREHLCAGSMKNAMSWYSYRF